MEPHADIAAVEQSAAYLSERLGFPPELLLILGSGLGYLADLIENPTVIPYAEIPCFPLSTVPGHEGRLVAGMLGGKKAAVMQGRFHFYEGYSFSEVAYPVRVMARLGVKALVVTNAAGGVNERFRPGDFMLIGDHIKLFSENPLRGPNLEALGPRFPDMTRAYDADFRAAARSVAEAAGFSLREGVYFMTSGPCFETPAEIRAIRTLGGDAVGMSTVPEVIAARHAGLRVLGFSCITNMAAGILGTPLSHAEVMETAERVKGPIGRYLLKVVEELAL